MSTPTTEIINDDEARISRDDGISWIQVIRTNERTIQECIDAELDESIPQKPFNIRVAEALTDTEDLGTVARKVEDLAELLETIGHQLPPDLKSWKDDRVNKRDVVQNG